MSDLKTSLNDFLIDLGWNEIISGLLISFVVIILWIIFGVIAIRLFRALIERILKVNKKGNRAVTVSKLIGNVFKYFIWFIVILMVLSEFNVNLTPFIASAGIIGLAIGFGAQEIVRDFISGFFIIFEDSFNVGDIIEVDGFKGTVLSLGLRSTIIENWKGERKIISNGTIGSIINFSKNDSIAIVEFGVAYETDLEKLNKLMETFIGDIEKKYEQLTEKPNFLGVTKLADSSIDMMLIAKTKSMQHFQIERDIRKDLVKYLNINGIDIPYPQVVIHNAKD